MPNFNCLRGTNFLWSQLHGKFSISEVYISSEYENLLNENDRKSVKIVGMIVNLYNSLELGKTMEALDTQQ